MSKNKNQQSLLNAFYKQLEELCKEFNISTSHLFDMLLQNEKIGYEKYKTKREITIRDFEAELKLADLEEKLKRSSWDRQMQVVNAIADVCIELRIRCKGTVDQEGEAVIEKFLIDYGIPEANFNRAYDTEIERREKEAQALQTDGRNMAGGPGPEEIHVLHPGDADEPISPAPDPEKVIAIEEGNKETYADNIEERLPEDPKTEN